MAKKTKSSKRSEAAKKAAATRKKNAAKRSEAAKKAAATRKRNTAKKTTPKKKTAAKKATSKKKTSAKKATPKKMTAAKKATPKKKTSAKKATPKKKTAAKKATPKKKTAAKKATPKKMTTGGMFIRPTTKQLREIYFGPKIPRKVSCSYCGIDVSNKMHIDHIRAWIKSHNNAKSNLTPACPECNQSKKAATLLQWFKRLQKNGGTDRRRLTKIRKYNQSKKTTLAKKIKDALKKV